MHARARDILRRAKFVVHPQRFSIIGLPASGESTVVRLGSWGAAIQAGDHVTYVLPDSEWQRQAARFPQARVSEGWKLITLDAEVPWDVYGLLAALTAALAERGIPCASLSSFDTDHLLVPEARLGGALQGLELLRGGA